ncbi:MAG: ATP-dependent metallopeptidase FtsH/Yme1/Tma family protein [Sphaerochaetaceae bacterium]
MDIKTPNKKPLLYYAAVAFVAIVLLNTFVFPLIFTQSVQQTTYDRFLLDLDSGVVKAVQMDSDKIVYTVQRSTDAPLEYYKTGIWPDSNLVERLKSANVAFSN